MYEEPREIEVFEGHEIELCLDMMELGFSEFRHNSFGGLASEVVATGTFFLFTDVLIGSLPIKASYLTRARHLKIYVSDSTVFSHEYEFRSTDKAGVIAELEELVSSMIDRSWHRAEFVIGDEAGRFMGWYLRRDMWNDSWYRPVFRTQDSFRILKWYNSRGKWSESRDAYFDASEETFVFPDPDDPQAEDDVYRSMRITLPYGASIKVYPIGTPDWTWSIYKDQPDDYDLEGDE